MQRRGRVRFAGTGQTPRGTRCPAGCGLRVGSRTRRASARAASCIGLHQSPLLAPKDLTQTPPEAPGGGPEMSQFANTGQPRTRWSPSQSPVCVYRVGGKQPTSQWEIQSLGFAASSETQVQNTQGVRVSRCNVASARNLKPRLEHKARRSGQLQPHRDQYQRDETSQPLNAYAFPVTEPSPH